jgi:DNA-directed RNA polymerase specialized sigma24 family protein
MADDADRDCLSESELSRLSDERLLAYIVEQREAGRPHCAKPALAVLAWGYWDLVCYVVGQKLPRQEVEDVAAQVMEGALKSAFDGRSVGEFVNWLKMIAVRRRADFHRDRERDPDTVPLPTGGEEDDGERTLFGPEPGSEDDTDLVHYREAAGRVLERRSEIHQLVIRLYGPNELGYMALSAREAAAQIEATHVGATMSEANVHKIWARFKDDLERELGLGGS